MDIKTKMMVTTLVESMTVMMNAVMIMDQEPAKAAGLLGAQNERNRETFKILSMDETTKEEINKIVQGVNEAYKQSNKNIKDIQAGMIQNPGYFG